MLVTTPTIALQAYGPGAHALLARWLREPHVARWYPDPDEHLAWAASPPPGGERSLIVSNGDPVGYIRWQVVSREVLDSVGLLDLPDGSVDVDILIGERRSVARGIGPAALGLVVARVAATAPLIGLTTSTDNTIAQRAFQKAGFRFLRRYSPPGYGECHLMVMTPGKGT